jgi:hypothetical protein
MAYGSALDVQSWLRGKVPGHLLGSVYGHMHARVGLGWAHGMAYGLTLDG